MLPTFAPHMFRYITAIFLLAAFAAQTFQQGLIVLGYYTNTASFARNCENKARPMMHCNGKCQMMKKLREEEKKGEQAPERKLVNNAEVLSSRSYFAVLPLPVRQLLTPVRSSCVYFLPQSDPPCIFHPPAIV